MSAITAYVRGDGRSQMFGLVESALAACDGPRADSAGAPLDAAGRLWGAYLDRVRQADPDALHAIGGAYQRHGISARADAASFYQGDTVDRSSMVTFRPDRPLNVIGAIPTYDVAPWARTYTAAFAESAGVAKPWTKGGTDTYDVDYSVDEQERPMMMFRADVVEQYGDAQQMAAASPASRDAGSQARQTERAIFAHMKAHNDGLVSGVAGFGGYSLATLPGARRKTSTVSYGDTTSGQIDAALAEFRDVLQAIPEESDGSMPAPDTILLTRRLQNKLVGYTNFEAGGPAFSAALYRQLLSDLGITTVALCDELKNQGGANVDRVVLFSSSSADSLRYVVGLRPAPVKTFERDLSTHTAFLSGFGGLYARLPGSVMIYDAQIST